MDGDTGGLECITDYISQMLSTELEMLQPKLIATKRHSYVITKLCVISLNEMC